MADSTDRAKIGVVTGLAAEAKWLKRAGFMVRVGGGTPAGAEAAARALVTQGARALISFGLAGGLKPGLKPGTVLVPSSVIDGNRTYVCDYALITFLGGATGVTLLAESKIVTTAHHKSLLYQRGKYAAVDLESGAVGAVARQTGLPFAVLRAVSDSANMDLPPAAQKALTANGSVNLFAVLFSVLFNPKQIPRLIELGKAANLARTKLIERVNRLPKGVPSLTRQIYETQ